MTTPIRPSILSQREIEVIQHIAEGLTDKEIAERLCITQRTVSEHIVNIRGKYGAKIMGDNHDTRDATNIALDYTLGFDRIPGWIMLERRGP